MACDLCRKMYPIDSDGYHITIDNYRMGRCANFPTYQSTKQSSFYPCIIEFLRRAPFSGPRYKIIQSRYDFPIREMFEIVEIDATEGTFIRYSLHTSDTSDKEEKKSSMEILWDIKNGHNTTDN